VETAARLHTSPHEDSNHNRIFSTLVGRRVLNLRDAARHYDTHDFVMEAREAELNAEPSPPRDAEVARLGRLAPLVTQDEIDDWVLSDDRPEFS
jgi:hypothetical protein